MNPTDQPDPANARPDAPAERTQAENPPRRTEPDQRPALPRERRPRGGSGPPPVLVDDPFAARGPKLRDLDAEIAAEMEEALAGLSDSDLLPESPRRTTPTANTSPAKRKGERGTGRIISIHGNDVFVEIPGQRSQGVLPLSQFEGQRPAIGSEVEFTVERFDPSNGLYVLTRKGAVQTVDWSSVARGQIVEARVTGVNRGGLSVEVNNIRGFLPISQIDLYRVDVPEQYLNQRLRCLVTEVDPDTQNLVVSRRALLEREREEQREQFWAELAEGQIREGLVRSIRPFGVFVDLGAADGLIPVSELAWSKTDDPASVVSVGQRVQVKVVRIDPASRKISLSLRALTTSPWDDLAKRLRVGAVVEGKVTRTTEFGAFVELEPGIEGLIHISELSPNRTRRVREVVQEGQQVQVMVLSIDPEAKRISLSLKAVQAKAEAEAKARAEAEAQARAEAEAAAEAAAPPPPPRPRDPNLRGGIGRPIHISLPPRPEQ